MSNFEPQQPYIYQPEPVFKKDGTENKLIYGISGPGAESYFSKRFTKEQAEEELEKIKARLNGETK